MTLTLDAAAESTNRTLETSNLSYRTANLSTNLAVLTAPRSTAPANNQVAIRPVRAQGRISVEWMNRTAKIPAAFWHACFRPPVEGLWWYEALEQSGLESQFQFLYGLVWRDLKPIAIVPAFSMKVPIELVAPPWLLPYLRAVGRLLPQTLAQPTLFIGSPCSDEGTIGTIDGVTVDEIAAAVQESVEHKAAELGVQMIVWKDFPLEAENTLMSLSRRYQLFPSLSFPGTIVTLTGKTMDDYYKSLKSSHRHNLKKKLKRSKEQSDLRATVLQRPSPELLSEIWSLFWQTYEKGETKFEQLTPSFFELIAKKPNSWFVLLQDANGVGTQKDKIVAFMLCFKIGDRVINKFVGIDYQRPPEWFLYFRLWEAALAWVIETGAGEFQSGQTGYRGKIDVGHKLVPLINYCRNRNPLIHEIYRRIGPTIKWSELDRDLGVYIAAHPEMDYNLLW